MFVDNIIILELNWFLLAKIDEYVSLRSLFSLFIGFKRPLC